MHVVEYHAGLRADWDAFAAVATTQSFLFQRTYLDHHADRFRDASLLLYDDRARPVALLPANRDGAALHSHQGLTYGGLLTHGLSTPRVAACYNAVVAWATAAGIERLTVRPAPHIYRAVSDEAELYCLFRLGATLSGRQLATVLAPAAAPPLTAGRREGLRKATRLGFAVQEAADLGAFWPVLTATLRARHDAAPVHTLAEMELLRARFPAQIRLHLVRDAAGAVVAGGVLYNTPYVARAQYLAATPAGRAGGALDLLLSHLIGETYAARRYLDLGTSNGRPGQALNYGLLFQKEGFGGRGVCYDTYSLDLSKAGRVEEP